MELFCCKWKHIKFFCASVHYINYTVLTNFTLKKTWTKLIFNQIQVKGTHMIELFFLCYDYIVVFLLSFLLGSPSFSPVRSCGTSLHSCCPRNRGTVSVQRCSLAGFPFSVKYHFKENIVYYVLPLLCHVGIMMQKRSDFFGFFVLRIRIINRTAIKQVFVKIRLQFNEL